MLHPFQQNLANKSASVNSMPLYSGCGDCKVPFLFANVVLHDVRS